MKRRIALVLAAAYASSDMASGQQDTSQRSSIRGPPPSKRQDASDGVRSWDNTHSSGIQTGEGYWSSSAQQQSFDSTYGNYNAATRPQQAPRDSAGGDGCRSTTSTQTLRCNGSSCSPVYHGGCDPTSEFARSSVQSRCEMPDARLVGTSAICYYEDVCCPRANMVVTSSGYREAEPATGGAESRLGDEWFEGGGNSGPVDSTYQQYLDEKYSAENANAGAGAASQGENWWGESWQGADPAAAEKKSSENAAKNGEGGGNGVGAGIGFAVCISAFVAFQVFVYQRSRRGTSGSGGGAEVTVPKVPVEVTRALGGLDDETTVESSRRGRGSKKEGKKKKKKKEPVVVEKEDDDKKEKTIYDSDNSDEEDESGSGVSSSGVSNIV